MLSHKSLRLYLFICLEGEEGKEKERERNIDWLLLAHPGLQPVHVP